MEVARVVVLLLLVFGFMERPWAHGVERGFAKIRWGEIASIKVDEEDKETIESAIEENCSELLAETTEKTPAKIKMINQIRERGTKVYWVLLEFPGAILRRLGIQMEHGAGSGKVFSYAGVSDQETGPTVHLPECSSK